MYTLGADFWRASMLSIADWVCAFRLTTRLRETSRVIETSGRRVMSVPLCGFRWDDTAWRECWFPDALRGVLEEEIPE
jgi:hypothetical protein